MLEFGDKNSDVKKLQENLIKLGYKLPKWGADGDFGEETLEAVLKFQEDYNLEQDGIVGPLTQAAIKKALNDSSDIIIIDDDNNTSNNNNNNNNSNSENITPATTYSNVMIGSASKDENRQYHGGSAGDQTGAEVYILNWYDGGWNYVIRPNSAALAEKIAVACEKACKNNNIGYDQDQRNTLLTQAKKVGMDISKITTPCECDCSSLVSVCCVAAGLSESIFFPGGNGCTTYNLLSQCLKTGQFTSLSSTTYTKNKSYLKRGDILLASGHTVIVLQNGANADKIVATQVTVSPHQVQITASSLNVRLGPSTSYPILTQIKQGSIVTIIEEKEGWGKLKTNSGWISLNYTKRI